MSNKITCTIINQLNNGMNLLGQTPDSGSNDGSGEWVTSPVSLLPGSGATTTSFVIQQKNMSNGSEGNVRYDLGNSLGQLVLMFHCNDSDMDYFYGLIQGYDTTSGTPTTQLPAPANIKALVQGWWSANPCDPAGIENMTITVTVSYT